MHTVQSQPELRTRVSKEVAILLNSVILWLCPFARVYMRSCVVEFQTLIKSFDAVHTQFGSLSIASTLPLWASNPFFWSTVISGTLFQ